MALTQVSDAGLVKPASDLQDNEKITLGTGNDLEIYHDGTNSYVEDTGTGDLRLKGSTIRFRSPSSESIIGAFENGTVELYYDNSKKLETTSAGIDVTGYVLADGTVRIGNTSNSSVGRIAYNWGGSLGIQCDPSGGQRYWRKPRWQGLRRPR